MAEILQFLLTIVQVVAGLLLTMIPGAGIWLAVLGIYLLVRRAARAAQHQETPAREPAA